MWPGTTSIILVKEEHKHRERVSPPRMDRRALVVDGLVLAGERCNFCTLYLYVCTYASK